MPMPSAKCRTPTNGLAGEAAGVAGSAWVWTADMGASTGPARGHRLHDLVFSVEGNTVSAVDVRCRQCGRKPEEITEYQMAAEVETIARLACVRDGKDPWWWSDEDTDDTPAAVTPMQFVQENDGTYNRHNGHFWCTDCYILVGQPLGVAP